MDQMKGMILNTKVDKKWPKTAKTELLITAKMTMKIRLKRKDAVECIVLQSKWFFWTLTMPFASDADFLCNESCIECNGGGLINDTANR